MNTESDPTDSTQELLPFLNSKDAAQRQKARLKLVKIGKPAVPYLLKYLTDKEFRLRWEAAMTLRDICDPSSAPALVDALMDDAPGVRWLSSEALIALGRHALIPLLRGLEKHFDSSWMREGAHHVLHDLRAEDYMTDDILRVFYILSDNSPREIIPTEARKARSSLRKPTAVRVH
jgi:HEAT repeat protein